ncbi:hypothetical protein NIES2134_112330 [Thermostichus vulcanus NIES-2134]|nr:hypothetical protein NIES2134_112330 [Thermostichus vulcanus NIES-2134]
MPETVANHFQGQLQRLRSDLRRLGARVESLYQLAYGALMERNLLVLSS